eukprot:2119673-Pyramimonas_sp.AAC.2
MEGGDYMGYTDSRGVGRWHRPGAGARPLWAGSARSAARGRAAPPPPPCNTPPGGANRRRDRP